ncbi:hypothetical protein QBC44DRAFT_779 [Cladorrhinum sp. PSN332]|nr:hypothetical protein QBC44DRAFT_779 [Cladorrhinum sp. PSN332]
MDPLSITSAIAGLIIAAAKIFSLIEAVSAIKDSPAAIRDAQNEIRHTEIAIRALKRLLDRRETATARGEMIQIDELRIVLADAMLAFSEFESLLQFLGRLAKSRVVILWAKYLKQIEDHVARLQRQKFSLTLMLNVIQCDTIDEAYRSQQHLQSLIERMLQDNATLQQKLCQCQETLDPQPQAKRQTTTEERDVDNASTIRAGGGRRNGVVLSGIRSFDGENIDFAFESVLEASWVYRRNQHHDECDRSFATSAIRSHAWSMFSGYSLADISILSVIAMPLTLMDISNRQHYVVEMIQPPGRHSIEPAPTSNNSPDQNPSTEHGFSTQQTVVKVNTVSSSSRSEVGDLSNDHLWQIAYPVLV